MAERSFKAEVEDLRLGAGETFTGEGILALTKALLENGVGYVGGYQGAPISHLMDVLADAQDLLGELGVRFEANANEAAAAAMLAASVHYPMRGAVTFKGSVGVNVASDALANLASSGVTGGALVIVGEDYGEGSVDHARAHACFCDEIAVLAAGPAPESAQSIVQAVSDGFELSEVSNTPVMLMVRIRSCHVTGSFQTRDNQRPKLTVKEALSNPRSDFARVVLPPMSFAHEQDKVKNRWPAAEKFIRERGLNEVFGPKAGFGIVVQGGMYNGLIRALQRLGLADIYGDSAVPIYVLNVTYPLISAEFLEFCEAKDHVLVIEEGQPEFIETQLGSFLYRAEFSGEAARQGAVPAGRGIHRGGDAGGGDGLSENRSARDVGGPGARAQHRPPGDSGSVQNRADPPAGFLHGLPRTADLLGDEAGGKGTRQAPDCRRHRLPSVRQPAAV